MLIRTIHKQQNQQGDTLIEVLFAVTVFSLIVVGALSLMNQGTSASRRALETTIARQAMDGQAETLRFMHESYVTNYQSGASYDTSDAATSPGEEYSRIVRNAIDFPKTNASELTVTDACPATAPEHSFVVEPRGATAVMNTSLIQQAEVYPELTYNASEVFSASRGIWVEAVRSTDATTNAGFIDFHIRTCWVSVGSSVPVTLGTIVRLYEPRG